MLRRLTIEDYYLIERSEIVFADGATIFTGETGSGKTMVLGALAFVLGERGATDVVRKGAAQTRVTLEFDAPRALRDRFERDGFTLDDDEHATIVREAAAAGKSSIRVNGRASTASYVREIAPALAEMIGQHEAQRLLSTQFQLDLLDRFAGADAIAAREEVARLHAQRAELDERLSSLDVDERRAQEQLAFARFALSEIQAAAPQPGEDEQLASRRNILQNAEKIALAFSGARAALTEGEGSASDALGAAFAALSPLGGIAPEYDALIDQVAALQSEVNDVGAAIARGAETIEYDAAELDAINARIDALDALKRKYGGSIESVLRSTAEFAGTIERFEHREEHRDAVRAQLAQAARRLSEAASALTAVRARAAARLRTAVESEFADLALPAGRFDVALTRRDDVCASGADDVEFRFAANKGEELRKLGKGASGGELSRVLLALVVALAGAREPSALVFDEIDAGIGGATAAAVAERIARLAQRSQVVCVTHLAQIASRADAHYLLEKREQRGSTVIDVLPIGSEKERAAEIARMLSGDARDVALKHARTLLRRA